VLTALSLLLGVAVVLGLLFAGSPAKLAEGVRIAGMDVGGMSPADARRALERREAALANVPVRFTDGNRTFAVRPEQLGVKVDWRTAVESAQREGEGFAVVRGLRRLKARFFPADLVPPTRVYEAALGYKVLLLARAIDREPREAAIVRRGLRFSIVPARRGEALDREAAAEVIVRGLADLNRGSSVALPVRGTAPTVTAETLAPALVQARSAVSAPIRLTLGPTRWLVPRWRVAQLLSLPSGGATALSLSGPSATEWFHSLARSVDRPAADARFSVDGDAVSIIPSRPGLALDVPTSARAILAAATRVGVQRRAALTVAESQPDRTTADAKAMGITRETSTYTTIYGGDPNRIHNVQLVAHLVDGALIAPGKVFSFNGTTGDRNAAKGFLEAPVIINGELQTGLGGGVCQVSTTVFNAAYEAGLPITERTNHALYISHYPLGRDATVNYPDTDLKFVNDTKHWLLLRTFVGSSSLTVNLYGSPVGRRIESVAAPLVSTGAIPVKKVKDPTLKPGERVVDEEGAPPRKTSVERKVYSNSGELLYDATFYSSYRGEPKVVRIGPKKPKKPLEPAGPSRADVPRAA
jgi:vancomycin resistance protein YoaR